MNHTLFVALAALSAVVWTPSPSHSAGLNEAPPAHTEARCGDDLEDFMYEQAAAALDEYTDYPDQVDPCQSYNEGCMLTPAQSAAAKQAVEQFLSGVFDGRGFGPTCS